MVCTLPARKAVCAQRSVQCCELLMEMCIQSINLLDSWATSATRRSASIKATTMHATLRHATATSGLGHFHHDGVDNALKLLLLGLELILLGQLVLVQPVKSFRHSCLNLLLELLLLQGVSHGEAIVFKTVLCLNLALV